MTLGPNGAWVREYEDEENEPKEQDSMGMIKIDIATVAPPGPGKKQGTIVTREGATYGFWPSGDNAINPQTGLAEVTATSRDYKGKQYWTITEYKALAPDVAPQAGGAGYAPWWMAFVSNTVAHAIQVGKIEHPGLIMDWAMAAKGVALRLADPSEPAERKADEDVPF